VGRSRLSKAGGPDLASLSLAGKPLQYHQGQYTSNRTTKHWNSAFPERIGPLGALDAPHFEAGARERGDDFARMVGIACLGEHLH